MNHLPATVTRAALAGLLGLATSSCSLLFVTPPAHYQPGQPASHHSKCTSSMVAPVLDTIFTGLEVVRVGYAATAPDNVYADPKQPLSRGADIGLGLGFTALFLGSAIYGYSATGRCNKLKQGHDDETPESDSEMPSEPESSKPRVAQPPPAAPDDSKPPPSQPAPGTSDDSETPVSQPASDSP